MDYSKMSDKEINIAVSIALGAKEVAPDLYMSDDRRFDFDLPKRGKPGKFFFDPCNSWADAGPIIQEYGIELGYDGVSWEASCNLRGIKPYSDWKKYPESPCRLAMIVFLMMHDKGEE